MSEAGHPAANGVETVEPVVSNRCAPQRGDLAFIGVMVIASLLAVAAVWLFTVAYFSLFQWMNGLVYPWLARQAWWLPALPPALGGVLIVWVVERLRRDQPLVSLANIIDAVATEPNILAWRRGLACAVGATLSLGLGVPVGEDTPSAMVGAHTAAWFGKRFTTRIDHARALILLGVAAGVAFAYDAQLAGVIFALEVVLGGFGGWFYIIAVLLGAGMSTTVAVISGGRQGTFALPAQASFLPPGALAVSLAVAVLAGFAGLLFVKLISATHPLLIRIELPLPLRAAIVGLLVGITWLWLPPVRGTGLEDVKALFAGQAQPLGLLLGVVIARCLLTPLCLRNGFVGGIIGPSLAIGAAIGMAAGQVGALVAPNDVASPVLFAMVGAAAVLAATSHAPVFAAVLVFETTGDGRLIAPLLLVSALAYFISRRFHPTSAYTDALRQWGLHLEPGRATLTPESPSWGDGAR